ncbi:hypothetical protein [Burkholderia thailandensis]|uniref:hypothetical protein n=1 Tax=Burkholderia thailandensis TaxID=57975 RepID=UPI000FD62953|nr:hypothetical protein [Burkholderia thailandensis]MBS2129369.1 hypothetical protein [Burkholderia thailandensis]MCS3396512.1 hypothetical protein [Burkholderia thailandensis]MCS6478819.1 hypothetical protein [Burkholderia thailandensis]MCS6493164.1 hypothetical protein [Burkholderia thailandensis]MCS6499315.1 hypothetical protein [Burkholderia thailandensis]
MSGRPLRVPRRAGARATASLARAFRRALRTGNRRSIANGREAIPAGRTCTAAAADRQGNERSRVRAAPGLDDTDVGCASRREAQTKAQSEALEDDAGRRAANAMRDTAAAALPAKAGNP